MDQKAFEIDEAVTSGTRVKERANLVIEYPLNARDRFAEYWQKKLKMLRSWLQSTPLTSDEVLPEFFSIKKTAPKKLSKVVCVTQAHGSMEAKNILEKVSLLEQQKRQKKRKQIF